jgi:hypothetical protein
MRIGAVVVACALGLAMLLGSAATGGESRSKATLKLADRAPLTLRGADFGPSERVRVTLSGEVTRTKRVTASRAGTFVVRFEAGSDRCSAKIARAVGARGSRAALKLLPLGCPPTL